jgi:hypothetical protein
LAADNLLKITEEEGTDILCTQEPHMIGNKTVGIPQSYKVFALGEGRKQAAIVTNNKQIDTILITQLSDEDAVVLETKVDVSLIIASMHFDINSPIDTDLQKMEATLAHAKGVEFIFAMDSNSRSTSWHDMLTNKRRQILEEFFMSKQLHIVNEESCCTTFRTSHGASNIDLTVLNNQALDVISDWVICDQESCSDHSNLKYGLGNGTSRSTDINTEGVTYKVTHRNIEKFQGNLIQIMEQHFCGTNNLVGGAEELD